MLPRLSGLLAGVWAGVLIGVGLVAAPSAFAALERAQAGLMVARLFSLEAQISVAVALVLMMMERRLARDRADAGAPFNAMSAELLLPAAALFCTVAGHWGLQPMMAAARAGQGAASFAVLHGASTALFGVKLLLVLALAWRASRR